MANKNLDELDVNEVASWLTSISLDKIFLDVFKEQQLDGSMLNDCEEEDLITKYIP